MPRKSASATESPAVPLPKYTLTRQELRHLPHQALAGGAGLSVAQESAIGGNHEC